jgi:hypothetical protein
MMTSISSCCILTFPFSSSDAMRDQHGLVPLLFAVYLDAIGDFHEQALQNWL